MPFRHREFRFVKPTHRLKRLVPHQHARNGYGRRTPHHLRTHQITRCVAADPAKRMIRNATGAQHHPACWTIPFG